MSRFKEKDLLEYFDDMCLFLANHHWTERDERAVAIREMIKAYAECQEIKADYVNMILQRDLLQAQLEKKKPRVTEEWIQKAIDCIAEYPSYKRLEKKLKEVGVEVVEK